MFHEAFFYFYFFNGILRNGVERRFFCTEVIGISCAIGAIGVGIKTSCSLKKAISTW
jgi:hypothetical protein